MSARRRVVSVKESPEVQTVVLSGPQGCGKTLRASELAARFGCRQIVDGWWPGMRTVPGALHLTHARLVAVPSGVRLVDWAQVIGTEQEARDAA